MLNQKEESPIILPRNIADISENLVTKNEFTSTSNPLHIFFHEVGHWLHHQKGFSAEEIDTHIYMFDRTTPKEKELYADCNAEAIIDNGVSKGFWIDKGYLNKTSFFDALETALHELCHKAGGDESATFSYKLTDVNSKVLDQLGTDSKTNIELKALKELWDESTFFAG